jgi:hypothetical protein
MNAELEALFCALEAFFEATDENSERLRSLYYSRLEDSSNRSGRPVHEIDRFVRLRFGAWKRAKEKPSTLPPKA